MAKCFICGEDTGSELFEFCNSCFELDPDELWKKFLQVRREEVNQGVCEPSKSNPEGGK